MNKPNHKEPTNWEHCCSCCPILEKEIKRLTKQVNELTDWEEYQKQSEYDAMDEDYFAGARDDVPGL